MNGYNPKYFNRNFIDSFKKSINESLSKGNNYGIGAKKLVNEVTTSGRESGVGAGKTLMQPDKTWDEIAREEAGKSVAFKGKDLTNVKYERKDGKVYADGIELTTASTKTSHYAADAPTRAGMAPKPAPANLVPASQGTTTPVKPRDTVMPLTTVKAPSAAPTTTAPTTTAPKKTFPTSKPEDKPAAPKTKAPDKLDVPAPVDVSGNVRPQNGPTAYPPHAGTPPLQMQQGTMMPAAKEAMQAASSTPAALRRADERIAATGDFFKKGFDLLAGRRTGIDRAKNAPGVIPVREPEVGSAIKPGTPTGVPGTKTAPLPMTGTEGKDLPGFTRNPPRAKPDPTAGIPRTTGQAIVGTTPQQPTRPQPREMSRIYRPGFESQLPTVQNIGSRAYDSLMQQRDQARIAKSTKSAAPTKSATVVQDIPAAKGVGIEQTKQDLKDALGPIEYAGRGLKHFLQRSLGRPET